MLTQEEKVNQTLKNYQEYFQDVKLAYLFSLINQEQPELFVLSTVASHNKGDDLINLLTHTKNFDEINQVDLPQEIKKLIKNMNYMAIDWQTDGWDAVKTIVNINNLSPVLNQDEKKEVLKNLVEIQENFGLKELITQTHQFPFEFTQDLKQGLMDLCDVAGIKYNQFGLNKLKLHYSDEGGDFTGYMQPGEDFIVVKKLFVLSHEWMHFIDDKVGANVFKEGYSLTYLMDSLNDPSKASLWSSSVLKPVNEFKDFLPIINHDNINYNVENFDVKVVDCAQFLHKYALNKDTFNESVKNISHEFSDINSSNYLSHDYFEKSIKMLLDESHAPRYFSFLKAQAQVYEKNVNDLALSAPNAFVEFSQLADKHLGEENYTESTIEVFARTFETYIQNECEKKGMQSTLCVHHDSHFYPQNEDKEKIIKFWEKGFAQIKERINVMCEAKKNKLTNPNLQSDIENQYTIDNLLNRVKNNRNLNNLPNTHNNTSTNEENSEKEVSSFNKKKIKSLRTKTISNNDDAKHGYNI